MPNIQVMHTYKSYTQYNICINTTVTKRQNCNKMNTTERIFAVKTIAQSDLNATISTVLMTLKSANTGTQNK